VDIFKTSRFQLDAPTVKQMSSVWDNIDKDRYANILIGFKQLVSVKDLLKQPEDFRKKMMLYAVIKPADNYELIEALGKEDLDFEEDELITLFKYVFTNYCQYGTFHDFPQAAPLNQLQFYFMKNGSTPRLQQMIEEYKEFSDSHHSSWIGKRGTDTNKKLAIKVEDVLHAASGKTDKAKPVTLIQGFRPYWGYTMDDPLAVAVNSYVADAPEQLKSEWYKLIALVQQPLGSKPGSKFIPSSKQHCEGIGAQKFIAKMNEWCLIVVRLKETELDHYPWIGFIDPENLEVLKGLVWACINFYDDKLIHNLALLAERCFREIKKGQQASGAVGNACLYTLSQINNRQTRDELVWLSQNVQQAKSLKIINACLQQATGV
jgi:hypothetical protein